MKYFMLIIDGVTDEPLPSLGGATPLERSFNPHMTYLAQYGEVGRVNTVFPGYPIESMVCISGLLGYDPALYYPHGRSSFEAIAQGLSLKNDDLVLRCNIVRVSEGGSVLEDFTAGMISSGHARRILSKLQLPDNTWELYPGQSYRNILIIRGCGVNASDIICLEPHMHHGGQVRQMLPQGREERAKHLAGRLGSFLLDSFKQMSTMRLPEGCLGNMLWVWSPSVKPHFPPFIDLHGKTATIIAGLDFMHGLAMSADIDFEVIPGTTGYLDTDYDAKARAAIQAFDKTNMVITHVNATDEAAHLRNPQKKIQAIEAVDHRILGPVLRHLRHQYPKDFAILVCGDHMTRCSDGKHAGDPPVYLMYADDRLQRSPKNWFCERGCAALPASSSLDFLHRKLFSHG